jgi:molecular chaperone GrpE
MIDPRDDDEEALLTRFRRWLREARGQEADTDEGPLARAGPAVSSASGRDEGDAVGLFRLVEEFTALRHELKLQTKSGRGLQEQVEGTLPALRQAIEQFRSVAPREAQAVWAAGKPMAEALADLDEALERGRDELAKSRRPLVDAPLDEIRDALEALYAGQSWLRRRWLAAYHRQVREVTLRGRSEASGRLFDALLEGYGLIQARLRRAMAAEEVERLDCLGRPVDPDRMLVVEVVEDPARPAGIVVAEVRRGYNWRGRLLRAAEVRASSTRSASSLQEEDEGRDDGPQQEPEPDFPDEPRD